MTHRPFDTIVDQLLPLQYAGLDGLVGPRASWGLVEGFWYRGL